MDLRAFFHQSVRLPLRKLGIHVCQTYRYPICTASLLDLAVPAFLHSYDDFTICQVGASDGSTSDPLAHLIRHYDLRGVLIEPLPNAFESLSNLYLYNKKIKCVNCAISDREGMVTFYSPRDPEAGVSTFQKSGLSKASLQRVGVSEGEIEQITVKSRTLQQVLDDQGISRIHLLQIDTEGFDYEIVKQALKLSMPPLILHFESIHLSGIDKLSSRKLLAERGYSLIETETDTLAFQRLTTT